MAYPNLLNAVGDTLSKFRAAETKLGDGFRPFKFRVSFELPLEMQALQKNINDLHYFMKTASLPSQTMETIDIGILGKNISYPVGINTSNEISLNLYIDDAHLARNYFDYWMHFIDKTINVSGDKEQKPVNALDYEAFIKDIAKEAITKGINSFLKKDSGIPPSFVWGKIKIKGLDMVGIRRQIYILHNVYPTRIDTVNLDTSDINNIASINITFKYTHYERKLVGISENLRDILTEKSTGLF